MTRLKCNSHFFWAKGQQCPTKCQRWSCFRRQLERNINLEATFPYSENLRIPCFHRTPDLGFGWFWYVTLIGISAQSGGNSWPTANPLNAPPQLSIPYVVPKQLWTLNELKAALIRKFPSFVYRRRTGLSKVTFLKVGWVKISKFLPRDLTQGELGRIEPTGVPLEVWAGFGIGILVLAPKFPYVVSIPASHTRNSSRSTNSSHSNEGIALHS